MNDFLKSTYICEFNSKFQVNDFRIMYQTVDKGVN